FLVGGLAGRRLDLGTVGSCQRPIGVERLRQIVGGGLPNQKEILREDREPLGVAQQNRDLVANLLHFDFHVDRQGCWQRRRRGGIGGWRGRGRPSRRHVRLRWTPR